MLPEGWKRLTVADICTMQNGNGFGPEDWGTEGLPIIRIQNMNGGKDFDYYSGTPDPRWIVEPGQLLFAWAGTRGVSFGPSIWRGPQGVLNQHIFKINAKSGIDTEWLYRALSHVTNRIESQAHGFKATLLHVKKSDIDRQDVLVPSIDEQRALSDCLKVWEDAIVAAEKFLANSRSYWLALMSDLLMPVPISTERQAGSFPPSVQPGIPKLPPTPKGWRKVALGKHLHEINRPVSLEPGTEYTLITVRRSRGGVDKRSVLLGNEIKTPTQFFVAAGDFLISKRQIVHGACGIVPAELDGAVVSNEYAVLGGDGEIDPRFLRYLSETTYFQQTCFHSSIGVHVEKMLFRTEQWLKRPFNIPPLDEQRRIVEILDTARQQMALAEQQLALLKAEKRALMQQLLTGKRRVHLPASEAASA